MSGWNALPADCRNVPLIARATRLRVEFFGAAILPLLAHWGCVPITPDPVGMPVTPHADGSVSTIAGTGEPGYSGDDENAALAQINRPMDLARTADGALLIADFANHRIRRIELATGIIRTIAGDGTTQGDAALDHPSGVKAITGGEMIVTAWGAHRIFRYATDGARSLVAGDGSDICSTLAEGASAVAASVVAPRSADVLADLSVLIAEQSCHRVRRVKLDGSILLYGGIGTPGYSGDGAAATLAEMQAAPTADGPSMGIALSPENPPDELFIADTLNHVVRVINTFNGRIETFVGTGEAGYVDGPPDQARFNRPTHVFSGADHSLWVVDTGNHAIRYIDPLRVRVTTVIGTGEAGFNGDGLQPAETQLNTPTAVSVSPEGCVYVADSGNHRIRLFQNQ